MAESKKKKSTAKKKVKEAPAHNPVEKHVKKVVKKVTVDPEAEFGGDKLEVSKSEVKLPEKRGLKVNKSYLAFTIVLAALALLVYYFRGELIVARVNGQPVNRLQLIGELEKQYKKQTLDNMVTKLLIAQEADKKGVSVTAEEVDAQIQTIQANIEAQGQDFNQLLEMQGFTLDSLKEDIRLQVLLEKLAGEKTEVTDADIAAYIQANADYFPEDMDDQQKQEAAVEQLDKRNSQTAVTTLLNELKGNADIQYSE